MSNKALNLAMLGLLLGCPLVQAHADDGPLRMRSAFTGQNMCLDIINDGQNNKLTMAACGNFTGQMWTFAPTRLPNARRLKTQFTGQNKCLDIINDGQNNKLTMADCGKFTGQMWQTSRF